MGWYCTSHCKVCNTYSLVKLCCTWFDGYLFDGRMVKFISLLQEAVLSVLKQAARLNSTLLRQQVEEVKHKHRTSRYSRWRLGIDQICFFLTHFAFLFCSNFLSILLPIVFILLFITPILLLIKSCGTN